ncbi:hypothetical protein J6590_065843 [Homalodisca vitripennis]|nr:hypothetical protein J6590_065843 [Homalodisca vitripennis]
MSQQTKPVPNLTGVPSSTPTVTTLVSERLPTRASQVFAQLFLIPLEAKPRIKPNDQIGDRYNRIIPGPSWVNNSAIFRTVMGGSMQMQRRCYLLVIAIRRSPTCDRRPPPPQQLAPPRPADELLIVATISRADHDLGLRPRSDKLPGFEQFGPSALGGVDPQVFSTSPPPVILIRCKLLLTVLILFYVLQSI